MVTSFDTEPSVGMVGPLVRTGDGVIDASARRFPSWSTVFGGRSAWLTRAWPGNPMSRRNLLTGPEVTEPLDVDWLLAPAWRIRREVFEQLAGFDEQFFMYWEDADLCKRAREAGWRVVVRSARVGETPRLTKLEQTARRLDDRVSPQRAPVLPQTRRSGALSAHRSSYLALQARLAFTVARATLGAARREHKGH